jgi:hypothetical protein
MAERLLSATRLHAVCRLRFEHGDWAERTIDLGTDQHQPSPDTFAQCGFWAWARDDISRAKDLLFRGIDLLVAVDEPAAALCLSYAEAGEHPRVPDPLALLEVVASKLDLDREPWVVIHLAYTAALIHPWPQPADVSRLVDIAAKVQSPMLMVAASTVLGHSSVRRTPPDYTAALENFRRGLDVARQSDLLGAEGESWCGIAVASVGLDPIEAVDACHQALITLYEIRYWPMIWQLFETVGLCLALSGAVEGASIIVGNLEAHHPPWGYEHHLGFRARALDIVGAHSHADEWMARGAAMNRYQIVEFALAALEHETSV